MKIAEEMFPVSNSHLFPESSDYNFYSNDLERTPDTNDENSSTNGPKKRKSSLFSIEKTEDLRKEKVSFSQNL